MIRKTVSTLLLLMGLCTLQAAPQHYEVKSPDGKLNMSIKVGETLTWSLDREGKTLLEEAPLSMTLTDGTVFGRQEKQPRVKRSSIDETHQAVIYRKKEVQDRCNQLQLNFKEFSLTVRVYDEGAAWRFTTRKKGNFEVASEQAVFRFPEDQTAFIPYVRDFQENDFEAQFKNSFENLYVHDRLSSWDPRRLAFLPLLVEAENGVKLVITEADLQDYPGMYLYNGDADQSLEAVHAPLPDQIEQGGYNHLQGMVLSRKPYIAAYDGQSRRRNGEIVFPWRVIAISETDKELADNDLVWNLAEPQHPELDFSWVEPGKVAWDWWNDWNLYDVDFETGVNTETYKHYIDFAAEYQIPYVILDEGWAVNLQADLYQVIPEIDLQEIVDYGKEHQVGIILWAGYWAINRDLEGICKHFAEMGVKGFKVDFMDRDDQLMVRFLRDAAETAARHHLIMDFHGTHKPTGLQRTWPNAINYEGVHGLEQMKWTGTTTDQVTYDVTIPYIRFLAGPADYTQGAMRNANKANYRPVWSEPMSQGTRCRQLAEYIVFESPFNMLCDSPSNYKREPECTGFIAEVPETWDETRMIDGAVAEYIVTARRKGEAWYVGGMTNWTARDLSIDLSFLPEGQWKMEIFRDGRNASKAARDFVHESLLLPESRTVELHLAPGGGFALKLVPVK